jgi:hypothetical protein
MFKRGTGVLNHKSEAASMDIFSSRVSCERRSSMRDMRLLGKELNGKLRWFSKFIS